MGKVRFDPTKPIDDPTVWYPHPDLWVKVNPSSRGRARDGNDDDDSNSRAFALDSSDFSKLNRYIWTAKELPINRTQYIRYNSISTVNQLPDDIWNAADNVIGTYTNMKDGADVFFNKTWKDLNDVANKNFNYAMTAGGSIDSSYYSQLLIWVDDYNKENDKDHPDSTKLKALRDSILAVTESEIKNADRLQSETDAVRDSLGDFHEACKKHQDELGSSSDTLTKLLMGQDGLIEKLEKEIKKCMDDVKYIQQQMEADRKKIRETAYYAWIPVVGAIAAAYVDDMAEEDIAKLKEALEKAQELMESQEVKVESARRISCDLTGMKDSTNELVKSIEPAINTLQKIQGAWLAMSGDLQGLHDLFENNIDNIPPIILEQLQLKKIVEMWNQLKDDVDIFRKNAYLTTEPPKETIDDYIKQLDARQKLIRQNPPF
ncbi:hypothetical protein F4774DRAFT_21331 [Daldinia eschscholtzii]|nr:hypothetical protein F4774DRAFT_21331 [Daldinia eschscholtzii]